MTVSFHEIGRLAIVWLLVGALYAVSALAAHSRTVRLSEMESATIKIRPGRTTVLNFPVKPAKLIVGNQGVFAIEQVDNDVAVSALRYGVQTNLFVYLEGRRFAFDLVTVNSGGDGVVHIRDGHSTGSGKKPCRKPKSK